MHRPTSDETYAATVEMMRDDSWDEADAGEGDVRNIDDMVWDAITCAMTFQAAIEDAWGDDEPPY